MMLQLDIASGCKNDLFAAALTSYTSKRSFPPDGLALQRLVEKLYDSEPITR